MAWNNSKEFYKLQHEWYAKLEDFDDCEGGREGSLMWGPTPSVQLGAAIAAMPGRLARIKGALHGYDTDNPKPHETWMDGSVTAYFEKGKSYYYDAAQRIATLSFLTTMPREVKFTWSMHSDGLGENVISDELELPRSTIRKYLVPLREKMQILIDTIIE